jgi:hypothetical protein
MNRCASGYFNIGDVVLMGKYKNKKGLIVGFGVNPRGEPTVEIEPIPKGRKQNKIIGLFKIWHADETKRIVARVMRRVATDLLKVPPVAQAPGMCGPASVRAVLEYYGDERTEAFLAGLMGATPDDGVEAPVMVEAVKGLGYGAYWRDETPIDDVRRLVMDERTPVIVDWFSTNMGHYSVVVGIDENFVYLQDPEIRGLRAITLEEFVNVWFDFAETPPTGASYFGRRIIVVKPNSPV